ncbi:MAG: kelch repeat-containing protein [Candidatus Eremiobacter antarcticus]
MGTVDAYNPTTNSWTPKASMPTPRQDMGVGVINGVLYAVGGVSTPGVDEGSSAVEAYDPSTNSWTSKMSMPTARFGLAVPVVGASLYAVGGFHEPTELNTVEEYQP